MIRKRVTSRQTVLKLIHEACEQYESLLKHGEDVDISSWVELADKADQPELFFELLRLEVHYDLTKRNPDKLGEYFRKYPNFSNEIVKVFSEKEASELDSPISSDGPLEFSSLSIGELVGRYRIISPLGSGGFSSVFVAIDEESNQAVALKVLRQESGVNTARHVECILNEANVLSKINHAGIPNVYDTGKDENGMPWVAMEYIKGSSLYNVLTTDEFSLVETLGIIAKTADAISEIHQCGFAHRDVKPDNIIVGLDGEPRILDYGLAIHEDIQREKAGERAGTTAFMSPEQVRGQSENLDGRTDIWSLGVILYLVIAKRLPFQGDSKDEIREDILHRPVRPPRQIKNNVATIELEEICFRALQKRPEARYSTAADFAKALRSAIEVLPLELLLEDASKKRALSSEEKRAIKLARSANVWKSKPTSSNLPGFFRFADFQVNTTRALWTENEASMMSATSRRFAFRGLIFLVAGLICLSAYSYANGLVRRTELSEMITVISESQIEDVTEIFEKFGGGKSDAFSAVEQKYFEYESTQRPSEAQYNFGLILAKKHPEIRESLEARLIHARKSEVDTLADVVIDRAAPTTELDEASFNLLKKTISENSSVDGLEVLWPKASDDSIAKIAASQGLLTDRYAWCSSMPIDDFKRVTADLRESRYRPVCVRPRLNGRSEHVVAAIWHRDSSDWEICFDVSEEELELQLAQKSMHLADICYRATRVDGEARFTTVWSSHENPYGHARLMMMAEQHPELSEHATGDKDDFGIISNDLESTYLAYSPLLVDVNCHSSKLFNATEQRHLQKLHIGDMIIHSNIGSPILSDTESQIHAGGRLKARAHFQLGNFRLCVNHHQREHETDTWDDYYRRAIAFAKAGEHKNASFTRDKLRLEMAETARYIAVKYTYSKTPRSKTKSPTREELRQEMERLTRYRKAPPMTVEMARAIENAISSELRYWLSRDLKTFVRLMKARLRLIRRSGFEKYFEWGEYYWMAVAANSVANSQIEIKNTEDQRYYDELQELVESLLTDSLRIRPSLIRQYQGRQDFIPTLERLGIDMALPEDLDTQWTSAWSKHTSGYASKCILPVTAKQHFKICAENEPGYFPVSLFFGERKQGKLDQGSVWHKERPTPDVQHRSQSVANALCYAIRHGKDMGIWKILASNRNSSLKNRIIESMSSFHVPPKVLIARMEATRDTTEMIAILQAIRGYRIDEMESEDINQLKSKLLKNQESSSNEIKEYSKIILIKLNSTPQ